MAYLFFEESENSNFDHAYMIPDSSMYNLTTRHHNGGYVACMDGHVEHFVAADFKAGMDKIGGGTNWYKASPTRPASTGSSAIVSPEELGARWNP